MRKARELYSIVVYTPIV